MEYRIHEEDKDLLILSGKGMDDSLHMDLVEELYEHIEQGWRKFIFDASSLEYISSLDISLLVRIRSRLSDKGGDLKLCGVKGTVAEIIKIAGLQKLFDILPDLESARRAFEGTQ